MADTVTVPGAKKPLPKWAVYAGVGGVAVAAIYYFKNKSSSASPAAAATSTDQYPPDGTTGNPSDPYSTDPATGQTYGDEAAGSGGTLGAYGNLGADLYPPDGTTGDPSDPYSTDPMTGVTYGNEGGVSTSGTGTTGPPFASNSAWSDWVIPQLETNDPNLNTTDVQDAIGQYLNGQGLTPSYKTIVFDAIAVGGDPPVAGANGYPPKVLATGSAGGGGTPKQVKVPDVVGQTVNAAHTTLSRAGLSFNTDTAKDKKGFDRKVTTQKPKAGTTAATGTKVSLTWHYVKQ